MQGVIKLKRIGNIFNFLKILGVSILFIVCALNLNAQVEVRAEVNTTTVTLNEEINLTVYVNAPSVNIEVPQMPSLPNFNIYSAGQSRQVNMVNGKVTARMQFNYILTPRFAGKTTIGAFTVKVAGKDYQTEPIDVEISRQAPSAPRTQGQALQQIRQKEAQKNGAAVKVNSKLPNFFMTAQTNTKKAYINEQVTLKIRFYQAQDTLGQPLYDKPQLKGMFSEDIGTRRGQETFGNKTYYYTEIESALFGLVSGVAEIGSATVTYTSSDGIFDAFDMFFRGANGGQTHKVESDILFVDILPLPKENKPASFYGAVGSDYQISSSLDYNEISAGEPVTLTLTVNGTGNLAAVKDIPLPEIDQSFRTYETSSNLANKISAGKLTGTKVYKTVIVPRASGSYTIPKIAFSYFDTYTKTYKTISSEELHLKVLPAAANDPKNISFSENNGAENGHKIQHISKDINYLKSASQSYFNKITLRIANFGNNNFYAFILILVALFVALIRSGKFSLTGGLKYYLRVKKNIKNAKKLDELPEILKSYLEAKMRSQIGLMNIEDVCKKLKLESATVNQLTSLWNHLAMLKYAPAVDTSSQNILEEEKANLLSLISTLEKEIK